MTLNLRAQVSLVPNGESEDEFGTIGLFFFQKEFGGVIQAHDLALHRNLQDNIFSWTNAGAVAGICH